MDAKDISLVALALSFFSLAVGLLRSWQLLRRDLIVTHWKDYAGSDIGAGMTRLGDWTADLALAEDSDQRAAIKKAYSDLWSDVEAARKKTPPGNDYNAADAAKVELLTALHLARRGFSHHMQVIHRLHGGRVVQRRFIMNHLVSPTQVDFLLDRIEPMEEAIAEQLGQGFNRAAWDFFRDLRKRNRKRFAEWSEKKSGAAPSEAAHVAATDTS